MRFADRREAGLALANALARYADDLSVVVLALSPGSVPIGHAVALGLHAPLDILLTAALRSPQGEQVGAVASGGTRTLDDAALGVPPSTVDALAGEQQAEALRREEAARGHRRAADLAGRTVILVGEALREEGAMEAAIAEVKAEYPAKVVVAVPVAEQRAVQYLRGRVDEIECVDVQERIDSLASCYADDSAPSTAQVRELLAQTSGQTRP